MADDFFTLFDALPEPAWTARADGFIDFYNRAWYAYTGTTLETMKGWGWRTVHDPSILPEVERRWQESLRSGAPFEMEFPLRRHDGAFRWFLTRVDPLRDANGKIVRWVGVNTDIHDRRLAAVQSDARFRLLVDNVHDYALIMLGPDGRVASWNGGARRIMQYEEAEIIGRHFSIFLTPEAAASGHADRELETARAMSRFKEESWRVRKDGTRFWANVTITAIRDEEGRVIGFAKVTRDLTEQRRAEAERLARVAAEEARTAAEAAESRFRFLAEASALLGASLDYHATLKSVAELAVPRFADWCSVEIVEDGKLEQLAVAHTDPAKVELARQWRQRWPPADDAPTGAPNVLRTGRSELYEEIPDELLTAAISDPEQLQVARELGLRSGLIVPLTARGRTLGALSLIYAESERRYRASDLPLMEELGRRAGIAVDNARLYTEARRAIELRDEFLSIASHELRTPLTSLALQVSALQRSLKRPETTLAKVAAKIDTVDRQVGRLTLLVNALLDVSRASAGRLQLTLEPVDLAEVAREVAARLQLDAQNAGCALSLDLPPSLVGNWDRMRLDQVLTNFLSNAIKYGPGQPIEVSLRQRGDRAVLSVRDHGIGIAADDQARIFERFGRAVSPEHYGGLGLGLWIVKVYVDAMGGTVGVESEPGRGSTFSVELPLAR